MNTCTVVIVNYNTGVLLKSSVECALKSHKVKQVKVVDNHSNDNSMTLLPQDPKLTKIYRKNNHGFASSCNYGAQQVKTDAILFLNPDCLIQADTVELLLYDLQQSNNNAVVGCMVNNPDGTEQRAARRRLPTFLRAFKTYTGLEKLAKWQYWLAGVNLNHQVRPQKTVKVEAISGALILMKTSVFNEIGGFDEKFPLHFEDLDLMKRVQNLGYDIVMNPQVEVIHHQGTSSQTNSKVAYYKKQGLERYFLKHCRLLSYYFIRVLNKIR